MNGRRNLFKPRPTLALERDLVVGGAAIVAGVDEVGVGAIAGPLVAAVLAEVRDSKQTPHRDQRRLAPLIRDVACPNLSVVVVSERELEIGDQTAEYSKKYPGSASNATRVT